MVKNDWCIIVITLKMKLFWSEHDLQHSHGNRRSSDGGMVQEAIDSRRGGVRRLVAAGGILALLCVTGYVAMNWA